MRRLFLIILVASFAMPLSVLASQGDLGDHTELMFVGEELHVLSIASRREEGAWEAPAVAEVVSRREFMKKGRVTLAEVLELTPGFYMAEKEPGTQPYLRGIPDSVLFLHDTVNMGSEMSKGLHPIDHELSLAAVKRIEIVRGPGSVLWGPDAFAGVVNVVPLTGRDMEGVEAGILGGSPHSAAGAYLNAGLEGSLWDGFVSFSARREDGYGSSANVESFFEAEGGPVPPAERYGKERPDSASYIDTYARLGLGDAVSLSGKISHYTRPYSVFGEGRVYGWLEERSTDWGYVKLEAQRELASGLGMRLVGSYRWLMPDVDVIDLESHQKEKTRYLELVLDKALMDGRGLLTGGLSYRHKRIENAPVWGAYLPDFLGPDNEFLLPRLTEVDYNTELYSFFGQYVYKIGPLDLVAGLRYDAHDDYRDNVSYNLGAVWSGGDRWVAKLFYGTACRTPFARQLLSESRPKLEKVTSLSAQLGWRPFEWLDLNLTGFINELDNHIMEDPYAGLSEDNTQTIQGIEFEARAELDWGLSVEGNLTLLDNYGPDETYKLLDYVFISPDGEIIKHYKDVSYPYDAGPDTLANISASWQPVDRFSAFLRLGYASSYRLSVPRNLTRQKVDSAITLDAALTLNRFIMEGTSLRLLVKNLTDSHHDLPGLYSVRRGPGASFELWLTVNW